ncbi:MAG: ribosomal protein S18-alanine N-acetyltransferase [Oscillospiraceae bacterium]|nr:ribosomal protein S18-alanine N-acetyltransferase [Oscillospiraceae bacterium]
MSEREIEGIAALEKECFNDPWSADSLKEELTNPNARFFAAVSGNEVLGYIGCILVCGEGSITNVAVKTNTRRMGVASRLIETLVNALKNEKAESIFLEVRLSNSAAQKLYEKFGFVICGERKDFYRNPLENAYIMKLSLN